MNKSTLLRREIGPDGTAFLKEFNFEDVRPTDKIFHLEGKQVSKTKTRKPDTMGRAIQRTARSGLEAKTYGKAIISEEGLQVVLPELGTEMAEEIRKYEAQGMNVIILATVALHVSQN